MGCMSPAEIVCPNRLRDNFLLSQWMSYTVKFGKLYLIVTLFMHIALANIVCLRLESKGHEENTDW